MKTLLDCGPSPSGIHDVDLFMRCPLASRLARGKDLPERDPLVRGSLLHLALAHHYARIGAAQPGGVIADGKQVNDPEQFWEPEEALGIAARQGPLWEKWAPKVADIYRAYAKFYGRENMRILAIETVVWHRFAPPPREEWIDGKPPELGQNIGTKEEPRYPRYDRSGRWDAVWERGNRVFIVDHKSTSRMEKAQPIYYARGGQFNLYAWMGKAVFGKRFDGMVLNRVRCSDNPKFDRPALSPSPRRFLRFPRDLIYAIDRMEELKSKEERGEITADQWPAQPSELICQHRYGACDVADQCDWGS